MSGPPAPVPENGEVRPAPGDASSTDTGSSKNMEYLVGGRKINPDEVSRFIAGKKMSKANNASVASLQHLADEDIEMNMGNVTLEPKPREEDPEDSRKLGEKVKDFFVSDYYVPKNEILMQVVAGVLAALAVVPESIAFALVVGVAPQIGIDTTFVTSIVIGIVGARPGLVNGASGAIAVVIVDVVSAYGEAYMGYTVILAGIIAVVFSLLRLSTLVCLISAPVMVGFVNGLGIIMCLAQVRNFKANDLLVGAPTPPSDATTRHLLASYDVFTDGEPWVSPQVAGWMFLELLLVIGSMIAFPKIPWKWTKHIPGSLIGIFLATAAEWGIVRQVGFATQTIGDIGRMNGDFPRPLWMRPYDLPPLNGETLGIIFPTAIALALVALIEQLMTVEVVNEMTKTRCNSHREAFGLGVGNICTGLLGGMGGNAMIAHSILQVTTGGKYRMANITVGICIIIISVAAFPFVNLIPSAAFVGMIWMMVFQMIAWRSFIVIFNSCASLRVRERNSMLSKVKRTDALIIIIVTVVTVFTNLAVAVACGVLVNVVVYILDSTATLKLVSKEDVEAVDSDTGERKTTRVYDVEGPLFFSSARKFVAFFTILEDPEEVELHCHNLDVMDYSALDAIAKIAKEYKEQGKQLHLRFLREDCYRVLAKGRNMLKDVTTWKVGEVPEAGMTVDGMPPGLAEQSNRFHVEAMEASAFRGALNSYLSQERTKSSDLKRSSKDPAKMPANGNSGGAPV
uniref:STAS domain-containing protein n=1 Tax=Tetraselmis chuii TaxID=63592 RepID=A0A7S1X4H1_9CHLO|mmetsp:Transcript_29995/g.53674  ORF Transcript_29995/g.53674 Transcript_29995/m.53674 type:complete len:739 (+) Transcript_29995:289-2505(+)|eukprot:CAMPEP_0177765604 /NCGR_PEP_ID=MMETSP0491_2-20121128/8080_1 /TAXON_ID=63592 /ORGANISM="Tetraselmis chuii, Strain PLY429" /LENGTH=738 /DNA_ID=CAMNT_0019281963 /DNA_START=269 /DNA_END=2485 /DNA_ORIENTATION=-